MRVACEPDEDNGNPMSGVNEFYAECRFSPDSAPEPDRRRHLVAAKPLYAADGYLVVALV